MYDNEQKKAIFYAACVPFRFLYAAVACYLLVKFPKMSSIVIAAISFVFAIVFLSWQASTWWHKGAHGAFALATSFFCITYYFNLTPFYIAPMLIVIDVLFGFVTSILVNPMNE